MTQFQTLYYNGATQDQIDEIKQRFASKQVFTWEEYYWGAKCIIEYDEEDNDPDLIIKLLKQSFRNGLTSHSNPGIYQDALKTISGFYSIMGNYDQVINHLMNYVDSLGEATPDWAYHDLINAQMHTDQIAIMIERPQSFLLELARNDNLSSDVEMKQKNLFRDFLFCAADYIKQMPDTEINYEELAKAAAEYELTESEAWKNFCEIANYKAEIKDLPRKKPGVQPSSDSEGLKKPEQAEKESDKPGPEKQEGQASEETLLYKSLKKENDSLKETISSLQEQLSGIREKNDSLQSELLAEKETNDSFRLQLDESAKKTGSLQHELSEINKLYYELLDKTASNTQGRIALQEEIARLKESIETLNQEKQAIEAQNTILQNKYNSALRQIEADEDFKFQLQDSIRSLSAQLNQSKAEYSQLSEQLEYTLNESHNNTEPSEVSIFGHCVYYLNNYCLKAGKDWLAGKLAKKSKSYMIDFVYPCLTNYQLQDANSRGWTDIYDFDIIFILRVIKQLIRNYPSFNPGKNCESNVTYLINRRNFYAHFNGTFPDYAKVKQDISVMRDFVKLMGGDSDVINEMLDFSDTISK